jgi:hypothetical protein
MTSTMRTDSGNARSSGTRPATETDQGGLLVPPPSARLGAGARPVLCGLAQVQRKLPFITPEAASANARRRHVTPAAARGGPRLVRACRRRRGAGAGVIVAHAQRRGQRASGQRTPAESRPVPARRAPRWCRPRVGNWLGAGQPLESPPYRHEVRDLLGLTGHPQLLLQLGRSNTAPATPRRPQVELRTN